MKARPLLAVLFLFLSSDLAMANHHGIGCLQDYDENKKLIHSRTGLSIQELDQAVRRTIEDATVKNCLVAGSKLYKGCLSFPVASFAVCKIDLPDKKTVQWCWPLSFEPNQSTVEVVSGDYQLACRAVIEHCYPDGIFDKDGNAMKPTAAFCEQPSPSLMKAFEDAAIPGS